jgi:hypothetical protein
VLGHGINDLSLLGGRCRPQAAVLQACVHPPCSTVPKSRNPSLRAATWLVADARAGHAEEAGGWSHGERLRARAVGRRSGLGASGRQSRREQASARVGQQAAAAAEREEATAVRGATGRTSSGPPALTGCGPRRRMASTASPTLPASSMSVLQLVLPQEGARC